MKRLVVLIVLGFGACSAQEDHNWFDHKWRTVSPTTDTAIEYIGLDERRDRAELTSLVGVDPVRTEWCAAFVNAMLELDGVPSLNTLAHPYPLTARGFLSWGVAVEPESVRRGDIVVFPRGSVGWQGHVGFYWGTVDRDGVQYYQILGGNQSNRVGIELYRADRALGIRRWSQLIPVTAI